MAVLYLLARGNHSKLPEARVGPVKNGKKQHKGNKA
jgi:hypothetical protein